MRSEWARPAARKLDSEKNACATPKTNRKREKLDQQFEQVKVE